MQELLDNQDYVNWQDYLVMLALCIVLILICDVLIKLFDGFWQELKMINIEISRSSGAEKAYWVKKKRKLWLSLLPFMRYKG